ncbi:acVLRF1 family peptidyl-tRNA hydrolase [Cryptosporangium arvum]|uniref:acVLRF1 family peptidyl-tRNA hydrolase n=1 Tax=Cryptosporangium arvum TaxID=80871 RepID=UPI0004B9F228|nr:acVLRF1 family peptidyl-tRNA hydrolase [Cryptosporangium arvum]
MGGKPAAGGGRWVEVPPERLERWLAGFTERHGEGRTDVAADVVTVHGADGAIAECHAPFPPLVIGVRDPLEALVTHTATDRRVGVLLVRLGGYAAGIFEGTRLVVSKVDTRPVHGRNKAGGWSQQRFARRREGQARQLTEAAAAVAERVLLPEAGTLDAVVLGGDRAAVDTTLENRTLAPLRQLAVERFLTVPDPRRTILEATPEAFRAARIRVAP